MMKKIAFILALVMCMSAMLVACDNVSEKNDDRSHKTKTTRAETSKISETSKAPQGPKYTPLTLEFNTRQVCSSSNPSKFIRYGAWFSTDYIEINDWYGIEYELAAHELLQSIAFYDAEKQYVSGIGTTSMLETATSVMGFTKVPQNAKYVRFIEYTGYSDMPAYTDSFVNVYDTKENYDEAYGESEYRDLVIACLGDSLTEGDYGSATRGIPNRKYKNYPYYLAKKLGCKTINYGKCGANSKSFYETYYKLGKVDISDADVIVLMLGTNRGLGDTYLTYYNMLISDIKKDMKSGATLILVTPPSATVDPNKVSYGCMPDIKSAYNAVVKISKDQNIPMIDALKNSPIQPDKEDEYQANDGLHMVEIGYKVFGEYMADEILKIIEKK